MGSQDRSAQLASEWMALMNVYPVVLWVNYFFGLFGGEIRMVTLDKICS